METESLATASLLHINSCNNRYDILQPYSKVSPQDYTTVMRRSCKQFLDNTAQGKNENNVAQCKPLVPESTSGSIKSFLLNGLEESKEENKTGVTKIQNGIHTHTHTHIIPRVGLS